HATRGLLLLSATPMRGNYRILHQLLSLIDPTAFPDGSLDEFRARMSQREQEADNLAILTSPRASSRQLSNALEALVANHPQDRTLSLKAELCRESASSGGPEWLHLADYVRETYRISRRMIRHRRDISTTEDYPVSGRHPVFVPVADPLRPLIDDF